MTKALLIKMPHDGMTGLRATTRNRNAQASNTWTRNPAITHCGGGVTCSFLYRSNGPVVERKDDPSRTWGQAVELSRSWGVQVPEGCQTEEIHPRSFWASMWFDAALETLCTAKISWRGGKCVVKQPNKIPLLKSTSLADTIKGLEGSRGQIPFKKQKQTNKHPTD